MSVSDESSEDEAQMKWEEQQIKKAVKLSQVICVFLTTESCFLLIGKRRYRKMQSQIGYFINAKLLLYGNQRLLFFLFFFSVRQNGLFFSVK